MKTKVVKQLLKYTVLSSTLLWSHQSNQHHNKTFRIYCNRPTLIVMHTVWPATEFRSHIKSDTKVLLWTSYEIFDETDFIYSQLCQYNF